MSTQCLFYRSPYNSIYCSFIVKFYFCFCRMDIDVYMHRVNLNKQNIERIAFFWQQSFKSVKDSMIEIAVSDIPIVHKEKLFPFGSFCMFRFSYIAFYGNMGSVFLAWNQLFLI